MDKESISRKYHDLTNFLIQQNLTISTMESITSGLIASLITDTEGASAVLKGAFVTYSNEAKIMQGVSRDVIEKYSVYSSETADEMATACARTYGANIGIGITGTAGNVDPANSLYSDPGEVYFSFWINGKALSFYKRIPPQNCRNDYKMAIADVVCNELFAELYQTKELADKAIKEDMENIEM